MGDCDAEAEIRALVRRARENIADSLPLHQITKLDLFDCGLSALPHAFPELLPNLSILFLSKNNFSEMPEIIGRCTKLQMVAFKDNNMTSIHPDALQSQLRWLILTDNKLAELPETIGRCKMLQKCMLSGNLLEKLPDSIQNCTNLELIRLASNRLKEPPMQLLQLPNLCWIALSENPFLANSKAESTAPLSVISDIDETAGEVLGQGAGGVTRKCTYRGAAVAVKQYCGSMTSDGSPESERCISTAASQLNCDALIDVLGETSESKSLVMEYLDNFAALAGPPSLQSCSRDVYPDDTKFSWNEASTIVSKLLDALTQLHEISIAHGDFYAHNILVNRDELTNVRLSDFGAAFFYDANMPYGKLLRCIELRAFAVFVDEVTSLLNEDDKGLRELTVLCRQPGASFSDIQIKWKQKMLADMAAAFHVDD